MNWFKKRMIIRCTQTVTKDTLKRLEIIHERNENLSIVKLLDLGIAQSGFYQPSFKQMNDLPGKFASFVFVAVEYQLTADGHAEWIRAEDFLELVIQTCSEYLKSVGIRMIT